VHSANGYLLDQFLRDRTNKRTDRYGETLDNRSRLLLEVLDAVTSVAGVTAGDISDSDPQTLFNHVAKSLSTEGLAYLYVIEGDTSGKPVAPFDYAEIKRLFGGLYMANHAYDKARSNAAIAEGRADLIAFGKPFIANPDLVTRFLLDAPLAQLNQETLYGGAERGYTDYPLLSTVAPTTPVPCWG